MSSQKSDSLILSELLSNISTMFSCPKSSIKTIIYIISIMLYIYIAILHSYGVEYEKKYNKERVKVRPSAPDTLLLVLFRVRRIERQGQILSSSSYLE